MEEYMREAEAEAAHQNGAVEIICESAFDAALYRLLCGDPAVSGIEFTVPREDPSILKTTGTKKGGYRSVSRTCRLARSNERYGRPVFGLLDGEEAARFGRGCELYEDPQLVFSIDDPSAEGLLFLGCYEKENLYLRYGNVIGMVRSRFGQAIKEGNRKVPKVQFQDAIDATVKASLIKCASKAVTAAHGSQFETSVIDVANKQAENSVKRNLRTSFNPPEMMIEAVEAWSSAGLADVFISKMNVLAKLGGFELSKNAYLNSTRPNLLSLCDGKTLLWLALEQDLGHIYEDLADSLIEIGFGARLRDALLAATCGRAVHLHPDERDTFSNREPLALRFLDKWRV